ncbi:MULTISPECIES: ABC transporter permease [unclassified Micromonospora]|uniref:ABC transporter permease n=1 Tax=unclassified Micromonospora TaxID=2617518 RepID=UPI003332F5BD
MTALLRLVGRRLLALPPMVLGITLLVFVVIQFAPNDPAYNALGEGASEQAREAFREEHGLNDPLLVQYGRFLLGLVQGDLGVTTPPSRPVSELIGTAFPLTLQLTFLGLLIGAALALALGVLAALHRDRWPDQLIRFFSIGAVATPSFWLGILFIQWFALPPNAILPSGGYVNPADSFVGWLESMALPAVALAIPVSASLIRVVRTSMVEELDRDYVRTAIGGGLPYRVVVARNVLRNALVTPITVLGVKTGQLIGGAVIIEIIFTLPGMGQLILNGITSGDAALVQGTVLTIAVVFVVVNIVVDLLYLVVNPRIRTV